MGLTNERDEQKMRRSAIRAAVTYVLTHRVVDINVSQRCDFNSGHGRSAGQSVTEIIASNSIVYINKVQPEVSIWRLRRDREGNNTSK